MPDTVLQSIELETGPSPPAASSGCTDWRDGNDFVPVVPELKIRPRCRCALSFPHAPTRA